MDVAHKQDEKSADQKPLPQATVSQTGWHFSPVWFIPLAALMAGAWLIGRALYAQGPVITIDFETAAEIEVGKTKVKFRNVELGSVTAVDLSADGKGVTVQAEFTKESQDKLTDTTRFWVVKPRIGITGVSGLETLLSGAYIEMDPGEGGVAQHHFEGLESPPRVLSYQSGTVYRLRAPELGSLSIGSPVSFRGIPVGSVVGTRLAEDQSHVNIEVFISAPHDQAVLKTTRFWNVSGVSLETDSQGVEVKLDSLATLFAGGVAFESSSSLDDQERAPEEHEFHLYKDRQESLSKPIRIAFPYLIYFNESVRGLEEGATVEFRGLRVGTVKEIRLFKATKEKRIRIGVLIGLEPERLPYGSGRSAGQSEDGFVKIMQSLVGKGLRAQLKMGNLLTGQKFVDFDVFPDAEKAVILSDRGHHVLPSRPAPLKGLVDSFARVLQKLETFPTEEIGRNLAEATQGANELLQSEDLREALGNLNVSLVEANRLLKTLNKQSPALLESAHRLSRGAEQLVAEATQASRQAEMTLKSLDGAVSEDGVLGSEAQAMLAELKDAARAIRIMAEYLERHPEALISGKR